MQSDLGPDVAYDEANSDPSLYEALQRSLEWTGSGDERTLRWTCPRCTHVQNRNVRLTGRIVALDERGDPEGPSRGRVECVCDCKHDHTLRPKDAQWQGCGYGATLVVEL